jgi:c-di-GMP-binding flagellar brake protein YcgR
VDLHPNVNDPVVLRDQEDREYRSRVEDLGNDLLVVERPHEAQADEALEAGTEVSVAWSDADGGVMALPTRVLAAHDEGTLRLLSLVVTGPASKQQRRRFVRVTGAGTVVLRSPEGKKINAVKGTLIDISEGGVKCAVSAGAADRFLSGPSEVIAEFSLGTADFAVPGRVEFLRPTKRPTELEELVVVFDEPVADADALRKQVFAQEVRTLRVKGESEEETDSPASLPEDTV